jgi:hypothetical protein
VPVPICIKRSVNFGGSFAKRLGETQAGSIQTHSGARWLTAANARKATFFARFISLVGLTFEAGINHWPASGCERASTIHHDRHIRERGRSRRRIVKVKDSRTQTEFGR